MTLKLATAARKLKVTMVLDAAPIAALRTVPDNAPSRTDITVNVGGRTVTADLATKSIRRAVKTLTDHGANNVVVILQGTLESNDRIEEAGMAAQVKAPAEPQP
jgi:succinyl-CoA synthetase beta subunit